MYHLYIYTSTYVCLCVHTFMYKYVRLYVYVCVYICRYFKITQTQILPEPPIVGRILVGDGEAWDSSVLVGRPKYFVCRHK